MTSNIQHFYNVVLSRFFIFLIAIGVYATGTHIFLNIVRMRFLFEALAILCIVILIGGRAEFIQSHLRYVFLRSWSLIFFCFLLFFAMLGVLLFGAPQNDLFFPAYGCLGGLLIRVISTDLLKKFIRYSIGLTFFFLTILTVQNMIYVFFPEIFPYLDPSVMESFRPRTRFGLATEPITWLQYLGNYNSWYTPYRFYSYLYEPSQTLFYFMLPCICWGFFVIKKIKLFFWFIILIIPGLLANNLTHLVTTLLGCGIFLVFYILSGFRTSRVRFSIFARLLLGRFNLSLILLFSLSGLFFIVHEALQSQELIEVVLSVGGYGHQAGSLISRLDDGFGPVFGEQKVINVPSGSSGDPHSLIGVSYKYMGIFGVVLCCFWWMYFVLLSVSFFKRFRSLRKMFVVSFFLSFSITLFFITNYGFWGLNVMFLFVVERLLKSSPTPERQNYALV